MTTMELPVRFNGRVSFGFDFTQGFLRELQLCEQIFCDGNFSVKSNGAIGPEEIPHCPFVDFMFNPFYGANLGVLQSLMTSRGGSDEEAEECNLILHLSGSEEEVVVTRKGKGFVVWGNYQASIQQ